MGCLRGEKRDSQHVFSITAVEATVHKRQKKSKSTCNGGRLGKGWKLGTLVESGHRQKEGVLNTGHLELKHELLGNVVIHGNSMRS